MYGMKRTTTYFPEAMKTAIEREAALRGVTEAEVIRSAVAVSLKSKRRRRPILPVIPEGFAEDIAGRVDEILDELAGEGLLSD